MRTSGKFEAVAWDYLVARRVPDLLEGRRAVVLERLARAAGATRWYVVREREDLRALIRRLMPGSCVSFYFDDRIVDRATIAQVREEAMSILRLDGEVFLGAPIKGSIELNPTFVSDLAELDEYLGIAGTNARLFVGRYPSREDDGYSSITLDLPDEDGIVRRHPH